jgi:hypothetical protein
MKGVGGIAVMGELSETIALVRDIFIIIGISSLLVVVIFSFRKIYGILASVRLTVSRVEDVVETIYNSGSMLGIGRLVGLLLGLNKKRGDRDG